jgi:hypothetical protein
VVACQGDRLIVHFTNRKNAPRLFFHITRDATRTDPAPLSFSLQADAPQEHVRTILSSGRSSAAYRSVHAVPFDQLKSPFLHVFEITFVGSNISSKNIVSQRKYNVEVSVHVSVVQAMMPCQELIDGPAAESPLLRLVHLQMEFVPRPVMKSHNGHEDSCPLPGYECYERGKWNRLDWRLAHSEPYFLVFARSDRRIAEDLGVMFVMHKSVSLKDALIGRRARSEKVPSVHQPLVYLMLDERHQNARENEPTANLKNKHQHSVARQ